MMLVHISNGGICEVINNGIDYAIVRWTCCRPLWDENMMNVDVRKVLGLGHAGVHGAGRIVVADLTNLSV